MSVQEAPTERVGTPVDGVEVLAALSPSRAADFTSCPLLYRFRTVDGLPEPPSPEATRGTLVHTVLERLFDLPADERTPEAADALLAPAWEELLVRSPETGLMFAEHDEAGEPRDAPEVADWLASCHEVLGRYFDLEDPRRLEPAEREVYVETLLESRLLLRGFVDRLDVAPDGAVRVVDYKTGKSPGERYERDALFQLKFYALALWRTRGGPPPALRLVYLGNGELLTYQPDEADLLATERRVEAVWRAITYAEQTGDWQPRRSSRCGWCAHRAICPAWGGTPPPLPEARSSAADPLPPAQPAEPPAPPVSASSESTSDSESSAS
ncbi:PD-(D/E)XK nuclease family protein [Nocardioides sp. C4-1]|uniref:RecB family exonuclease n=1 Tax=Nocardioides sp. C4-1 TaxID=3151851 RepID=UPI003264A9B1